MELNWMAWTWQTALFFSLIGLALVSMGVWSIRAPQAPRRGLLRIETTPGDRLFISLLGSAWICLLWLATFGSPLWWALLVCVVFALAVFRWV
ncbi:MAG TPA: DUF2160 domain-containing protein [Thiolinea sp.]|nr:DUF2160 domain-containing protein [Thiolinea sp.]